MTTGDLDPLIHVPTRLKIVATLAALPDGDTLAYPGLTCCAPGTSRTGTPGMRTKPSPLG